MGRFLYVNRQDDEMVSVYSFTPEFERKLAPVQTISVRTSGMKGRTEPAAIRLCPGGRLLAVSNRGMGRENREDSISLYGVEAETGRLTLRLVVKTGGEMPRDINSRLMENIWWWPISFRDISTSTVLRGRRWFTPGLAVRFRPLCVSHFRR